MGAFSYPYATMRRGKDMTMPNPDIARNTLIQIVTAARKGDMNLAQRIAGEYEIVNGTILPLFISAVSMIETVLRTVGELTDMDSDNLWQGIALGLTIRQMQENQQEKGNEDAEGV